MTRRQGGGVKKSGVRDQDVYFHPIIAEQVIEHLYSYDECFYYMLENFIKNKKGSLKILDCCCGKKALGIAMENICKNKNIEYKIDYIDNDETLEDEAIIKKDILRCDIDNDYSVILCNPPFAPVQNAEKIYKKLTNSLMNGGILIFVINNTFLYAGIDRAVEILYRSYYFLPRFTFASAGKPLLDIGVIVYCNNERQKRKLFIPVSRIKKFFKKRNRNEL